MHVSQRVVAVATYRCHRPVGVSGLVEGVFRAEVSHCPNDRHEIVGRLSGVNVPPAVRLDGVPVPKRRGM